MEKHERTESEWRASLLGWLAFAEISDRRQKIKKAHRDTFEWIFEPGNTTGFAEWLQTGDGIFWISGKPASGKSTLIKFVTDEERLHILLKKWTGNLPLVVASFWFWAGGTPLQKSLVGLYRTLLLQMLKEDDRLCRIAFPDWQLKFNTAEATLEMLSIAMENILSDGALSTNFFFIVDGLDEYERDNIGKSELAELMGTIAKSPRVKILLSSRPEAAFERYFRACPSLRLEDLTRRDITKYIHDQLWSNNTVRSLSESEKVGIDDIAAFVSENARGVFLWVRLVMAITLDGISNYEDVSSIRDHIMRLPLELDDLFTHILTKRIPQPYRPVAFRYLLLALSWESNECEEPLYSVILAMAHQASEKDNVCSIARSSESQIEAAVADFPSRLRIHCHGLLECVVRGYGYREHAVVTFMHRTLLDYLQAENQYITSLLQSEMSTDFEVHTAIMAGIICFKRMETLSRVKERRGSSDYLTDLFRLSFLAEGSACSHTTELIDILDRTMTARSGDLSHSQISDFYNSHLKKYFYDSNNQIYQRIKSIFDRRLLHIAYSICSGGTLYLRDSLQRGIKFSDEQLNALLVFSTPWVEYGEMSINLGAAALLVENGADPMDTFGMDQSSWHRLLSHLFSADSTMQLQMLTVMTQMANRILHGPKLEGPKLEFANGSAATASEKIQLYVLRKPCCHGTPVSECFCEEARKLAALVDEVVKLIYEAIDKPAPNQTKVSKSKTSSTQKFKQLLPWRRRKVERSKA